MTEEKTKEQIAALEHELAGYEARGMTDRAEGVRAEIARLSGTVSRPARQQSVTRLAGTDKTTRKRSAK